MHVTVNCVSVAARRSAPHVLAALIEKGGLVSLRNRYNQTPLHMARKVAPTVYAASAVLRTLEVNSALCHGVLGLEEHSDIARIAGGLTNLLTGGNGRQVSRNTARSLVS